MVIKTNAIKICRGATTVSRARGSSPPALAAAAAPSSAKHVSTSPSRGRHVAPQLPQHPAQNTGQHRGQHLQQPGQQLGRHRQLGPYPPGSSTESQRAPQSCVNTIRCSREKLLGEEADDVIDLGAPRCARSRRRAPLTPALPNPRLYPGPKPKPQPRRISAGRKRRSKRTYRWPVPNSRLYRPAPPRPVPPPPPPPRPRAAWPPPAPPRLLDTASRVALRLGSSSPSPSAPPASPARHLVVTLPRYRPASEHFRARANAAPTGSGASTPPAAACLPRVGAMDATGAGRHSASPEDRSEGNDTLSAPSEFLAEFLSAIMRRQYAEALKYCRLILQYEPHNATAQGFYPLLRHKLRHSDSEVASVAGAAASGPSDEEGAGAGGDSVEESPSPSPSPSRQDQLMSQSEAEASVCSDHSDDDEDDDDLELDSSDALHSEQSLSLSRRTDSASGSASASAGCWESTGTGTGSGVGGASREDADADADDNGNTTAARMPLLPDDLENDNAAAAGGEPHHTTHLKSPQSDAASSLRRLRAQFACSIK